MRLSRPLLVQLATGGVLATLSACGGGDGSSAPPPSAPVVSSTTLSGTVAVGAPITSGLLRVLDADGNVVAHDVAIDADGRYPDQTLTGRAPWRLEACGYAGANYRCLYAVAQAAGTANVTPLTSALITLASGATPETLMQAGGTAPNATQLAAAQTQLQTGLAGTLTDAGVGSHFDFTTGALDAGTRSGYDRILDAIDISTGTDSGAFVQVTPRLGDGNLYLTTGSTTGTITAATGAAALPLGGLETLFQKMTAAAASASACSDPNVGLSTVIASDARLNLGDSGEIAGGTNVAAGLCQFFGSGDDGETPIWGSRFVSPTLGKCDFSGTDPLCAISFALADNDGGVENVGNGMGVVYRGGRWQFYGDLLPIEIDANAAVQRSVRVDDPTTPAQYSRALQFDIAVTPGVQCVRVSQLDDAHTPIAYYKVYSQNAPRMSLWMTTGQSFGPSLDPTSGAMNGADSTWLQLPDGTAGDEVIRTFYRAGRGVTVSLFSDSACSTPATLDGKTAFTVDVAGMPPISSALPSLAWGTLTPAALASLESLTLAAGTPGSYTAAWTFADGVTGFDGGQFCVSGSCGQGDPSRLGDKSFHPSVRSVVIPLHEAASAVAAGDYKELVIGGRDGAGMNIESEFVSCSGTAPGQLCGKGGPQPSDPNAPGTSPGTGTGTGTPTGTGSMLHRRVH